MQFLRGACGHLRRRGGGTALHATELGQLQQQAALTGAPARRVVEPERARVPIKAHGASVVGTAPQREQCGDSVAFVAGDASARV